jgi:hypothetical protein
MEGEMSKSYQLRATVESERIMGLRIDAQGFDGGEVRNDLHIDEADSVHVQIETGDWRASVEVTRKGELRLSYHDGKDWKTKAMSLGKWTELAKSGE